MPSELFVEFTGTLNRFNKLKAQIIREIPKLKGFEPSRSCTIDASTNIDLTYQQILDRYKHTQSQHVLHTSLVDCLADIKSFIFNKNAESGLSQILNLLEARRTQLKLCEMIESGLLEYGNLLPMDDKAIRDEAIAKKTVATTSGEVFSSLNVAFFDIKVIRDQIRTLKRDINALEDKVVMLNSVVHTISISKVVADYLGIL